MLFRDPGGVYVVEIEAEAEQTIRRLAREASPLETGGALVGRYSDDGQRAVVTAALPPPPDSVHGPFTLTTGSAGLEELFADLWLRSEGQLFFVGDWHTHPGAPPEPSPDDLATWHRTATKPEAKCPEVIGIIAGGDGADWSVHVTSAAGSTRLLPVSG